MSRIHRMSPEQLKMAEELLFSERRVSGFAKEMFLGRFAADLALPWGGPPDDEAPRLEALIHELRAFLKYRLDPDRIDREAEIPREVILGLGEIGVLGMTVPVEFGGGGYSVHAYVRVMQEIAARCGSTGVFVNAHQSIGLRTLLIYGNAEQKSRLLPDLCAGRKIAAFALTEPEAGSDVANVQTRAVYDAATDEYVINGQKRWITNGGIADCLTVMAKTEVETANGKEWKISAFLVEAPCQGLVIIDKRMEKTGIRGTWTAKMEFHDLRVPAKNLLGKKGAGLSIPLNVLNFGRITFGACCTGAARYCLQQALEHARSRVQFGRPLGGFGMIKAKIARIAAKLQAMEAATQLCATLFDRGHDVMLESAMVKVYTSEALWDIVNETIQIHGGKAFFCDQPFERMMRDARLNSIGEGANEVLRNFVGLVGVRDLALQLQALHHEATHFALGKLFAHGARVAAEMVAVPSLPLNIPGMDERIARFAQKFQRLHWEAAKTLARHKEDIVEEQLAVDRLAAMAISLYTGLAVLCRLDARFREGLMEADELHGERLAVIHYLDLATLEFDRAASDLQHSDDDQVYALADWLSGV